MMTTQGAQSRDKARPVVWRDEDGLHSHAFDSDFDRTRFKWSVAMSNERQRRAESRGDAVTGWEAKA